MHSLSNRKTGRNMMKKNLLVLGAALTLLLTLSACGRQTVI